MLLSTRKYYRIIFALITSLIILLIATGTAVARPLQNNVPKHYRIVVDTDAGPDDLMALSFLLGRPDVEIIGITLVTGLSSVEEGAQNVLRLLALTNAGNIPVYMGPHEHLQPTSSFPLVWMKASEAAGKAAAAIAPQFLPGKNAVNFLAGVLMQKNPGIQILALGPLTNLALALRLAGKQVQPKRAVIMGGAFYVPGNLQTPEFQTSNNKSEWNFYSDPVAAKEVLQSALQIELVPLDATQAVKYDSCFVNRILAGRQTPNRIYVQRLLERSREWIERGDYYAWDLLAAVVLLNPETVQFEDAQLSITLTGPYEGRTQLVAGGHKMKFARHVNANRFATIFNAGLNYEPDPDVNSLSFFCGQE